MAHLPVITGPTLYPWGYIPLVAEAVTKAVSIHDIRRD
jgi:hypothetical protein